MEIWESLRGDVRQGLGAFWAFERTGDLVTHPHEGTSGEIVATSTRAVDAWIACLKRINQAWLAFYSNDEIKSAFDWTNSRPTPGLLRFDWCSFIMSTSDRSIAHSLWLHRQDIQQLAIYLLGLTAPRKDNSALLWRGRLDATIEECIDEAPTLVDVLIFATLNLMRASSLSDRNRVCQWAMDRGWGSPFVFHAVGISYDQFCFIEYNHQEMHQKALGACEFLRDSVMGTDLQWALLDSDPHIGFFLIRKWSIVSKDMWRWVHSILYDMARAQFVRRGPKPAYAIPTPAETFDYGLDFMNLRQLFGVWMTGHVLHSTRSKVDVERRSTRSSLL